ncbi:uncharacterized PE-PGRS family protein PE_PGRS54-like [Takifugu flavidus]|nr:uncharacterized PE-PGRS family protein PE_PGRS54-like [Takifugu flavidus]
MVGPMESGAVYVAQADLSSGSRTGSRTGSRDGTAPQSASDGGTPRTSDSQERGGGTGTASNCTEGSSSLDKMSHTQDMDWVQSETLPREHNLVMTRSGSVMGPGPATGAWVCDSATLPMMGRRASRTGSSPKASSSGQAESNNGGGAGSGGAGAAGSDGANGGASDGQQQNASGHNYATVLQGEVSGQRDYSGTLGRGGLEIGSNFVVARQDREGGGISSVYPEAPGFTGEWRDRVGIGGYILGRRDITPQIFPFPGQPRGTYGFGPGWVPGMEAPRGAPGSSGPSLALRVGEFLRLRLAQVTFDPSQPPYDSVQVYGLEGTGSRAGSLSSLESEGEKDTEKEEWGTGLEEWGPQFQKLAQLFKDREKEREDKEKVEETEKKEDPDGGAEPAGEEGKD